MTFYSDTCLTTHTGGRKRALCIVGKSNKAFGAIPKGIPN